MSTECATEHQLRYLKAICFNVTLLNANKPQCSVLKVPLKCIQTSTMRINVFSFHTRPCSWPLTWTLRAPVPPKCVVSPLPSGLPCSVTVFGSILRTTHMQSQYWVPGSPTQAMMTAPECDLWRMKHLYMHSIKTPQRARAQKSYHPSGISTMDFSYARIVCSRVAAPMKPV